MVFYFTATGNSLYVARQLDRACVSIPQVMDGSLEFAAERIGVVCPIYGHEMPEMVKRFLAGARFETGYFYLVLTYGRIHGGAAELAEQYLRSVGKEADYINTIMMVDNFLPGFDMTEQLALDPEKRGEEHIAAIRADVEAGRRYRQPVTQGDRDWHRAYLRRQRDAPAALWTNLYRVTDACVGCGICARVCPAGCIRLEGQRAVHTGLHCQSCMACIHSCPQKAIRLNLPEKNPDARYRNGHIRLMDLVNANNQHKSL